MAKLIIRRDGSPEREIALEATTSIGRLPDCTVQLEDPQISRVHALITTLADGYMLSDQGSMNGTFHNRVRLDRGQELKLEDGDLLHIAGFELQLCEGVAATSTYVSSVGASDAPAVDAQPVDVGASKAEALAELEKTPCASILLSHLVESREAVPVWSKGEIALKVVDIINETADAKTYRLAGKTDTLFSYKPGQFVTISLDIDGETVKRSYSISSSPSRPHTLELTIKRVPGGLVSNWMADRLQLGDEIQVRGPAGKFSCFNYPSRKMFCIAGGSGITPIMSMLRWIVDTAADIDLVMLVCGHTPSDFIFRKELETVAARHRNLRVLFTVTSGWSGTEGWTGLSGRIDRKMIELVAPDILERHVFMCGPKPFGEAMKSELAALNYPIANLHTESFGEGRVAKGTPSAPQEDSKKAADSAAPPKAAPAAKAPVKSPAKSPAKKAAPKKAEGKKKAAKKATPAAAGFKVTFKTSGVEAVASADGKLLDLAETHGVEIDYACRMGSCGSCRTKCLSGSVTMEENDLDDDERAEGWIYPCVACATSDVELEV